MKRGVIFFSGRGKSSSDWNVTELGKRIDIETTIAKRAQTMLISLQEDDFLQGVQNFSLSSSILNETKRTWILISHSLGVVFVFKLLNEVLSGKSDLGEGHPFLTLLHRHSGGGVENHRHCFG